MYYTRTGVLTKLKRARAQNGYGREIMFTNRRPFCRSPSRKKNRTVSTTGKRGLDMCIIGTRLTVTYTCAARSCFFNYGAVGLATRKRVI